MNQQQPPQPKQPQQKRKMSETEMRANQVAGYIEARLKEATSAITGAVSEAKEATLGALRDAEGHIMEQVRKPERYTDRLLMWWMRKSQSWIGLALIVFLICLAFSVGKGIGGGG